MYATSEDIDITHYFTYFNIFVSFKICYKSWPAHSEHLMLAILKTDYT